jgi:hypothetical protein
MHPWPADPVRTGPGNHTQPDDSSSIARKGDPIQSDRNVSRGEIRVRPAPTDLPAMGGH